MPVEYDEPTAQKCDSGADVTVTVPNVTANVLGARAEFYAFPTPSGKLGEGTLVEADGNLSYAFSDQDDLVRFVEVYLRISGELNERKEEPPLDTDC